MFKKMVTAGLITAIIITFSGCGTLGWKAGVEKEKFTPTKNMKAKKTLEEDLNRDGKKENIVFYQQENEQGRPVAWTVVVDGYQVVTLDGREGIYTLADIVLKDVDGEDGPEMLFYRYNTGTSGRKGLNVFKPGKNCWHEMFTDPNTAADMNKDRFEMKYLGNYRVSFKDKETGLEHTIELGRDYTGSEEMLDGISSWVDPIAEYRINDINDDGVNEIITIQRVIGISHADTIAILKTVYRLQDGTYRAEKVMLTTYTGGFLNDTGELLAERSL